MKEPVDHILRPRLPWRSDEGSMTECGLGASKVRALTREEFVTRLKAYGQQRTALLTCMTCSDAARRWETWEQDPRQALSREITWERGDYYRARQDRGDRLKEELIVVAELVAEHREKFEARLVERHQRKEWLAKKAAHNQKLASMKAREP